MEIDKFSWAKDYFDYLEYKSKGLRQKAFDCLNQFFTEFKNQGKEERRKFIDDLNLTAFKNNEFDKYIPYNLYKLFLEEIECWKIEEPNNSIAFRWTRNHIDLIKSISLDPTDQVTIQLLCSSIVNKVSMNQHELNAGFGYQGNPDEDLKLLKFLNEHLDKLGDQQKELQIQNIVKDLEDTAKKYT